MKKIIASTMIVLAVLSQNVSSGLKESQNGLKEHHHLRTISRLSKVLDNKVKAKEAQ
jgi:hypothetical protein